MQATELINDLKAVLAQVKTQGQTAVPIDRLEDYLATMEGIANARDFDQSATQQRANARAKMELDFEVWKVRAPLQNDHQIEMFKSVIEAGQTALKSATLINGGAAVALLAFLGNLLTKEAPKGIMFPIASINYAMAVFVAGVGFAGLATGVRYLTQFAFAGAWLRTGHALNLISNLLALASFAAFFWGGHKAYLALGS